MSTKPRIAVVEDDPEIRRLLLARLEREAFRVEAADGGTAFDRLVTARGFPDLIVLDIMLPGEDGFSICRRVRAHSRVPIIMLTARGDDIDRIVGLELGADDYVPKPFNPRELVARIRAILRRMEPPPVERERYRVGGLMVDVAAREIATEGGLPVELTGGEFDLFACFLSRPQRVLSREQLIEWTRGRDANPFDRTIDVQMSRLRRKLVEAGAGNLFKTVRNAGYVLTEFDAAMIARLGLVGRLVAIGALGFSAVLIVLGVLVYQLRAQEGELERRFPLPAQIAAIVDLIDRTAHSDRALTLAALNTPALSVGIDPGPPVASAGSRELPRIENVLGRVDPALASREVVVDIPGDTGHGRPLLDAWTGSAPLRAQVGLTDGSHVSIEARGEPVRRALGVPSGFWLAAIGILIAALTLFGLFRTAQPLRRLTTALESFSETASPVVVKPSGPPDVQRLIGTFNRMQERLSALVKGRTILAGAISHDLRTYLTRLRLRVDTITDDAERAGAEGDIEAMTGIVDNALVFARSATVGGARETLDLRAIVNAEVERYRAAGSTVVWLGGRQTVEVRGEAVALRRVLANLLDNALRYAGRAEIHLSEADGCADLTVDDDGGGIPVAEREAIFEPFYRLEASRNIATGGTGLGLALTRQIVEAHDGRISAGDSPQGGTRMRVLLPLVG